MKAQKNGLFYFPYHIDSDQYNLHTGYIRLNQGMCRLNNLQACHLYKALTDETRIKSLQTLHSGECCACELLKNLSITQSTLSHHMKCLTELGLVKGRKDGRWMRYSLNTSCTERLYSFTRTLLVGQG